MLLGVPLRPFTPAIKFLCFSLRIGLPRCYRPDDSRSGEGISVLDTDGSIFSAFPTFKATTKSKKTFVFSCRCSGTENSKSSALVIRLRVSVDAREDHL